MACETVLLREAITRGATRFSDFEAALSIATNILSQRLDRLIANGMLERQPYRELGSRARLSYHPTRKGLSAECILSAMQRWSEGEGAAGTKATSAS